jgi:hypothetical protein
VDFATLAREKFFDNGDFTRAAFFAEQQAEQEAKVLAQDQLKESTAELRKSRAEKVAQKELDDQKVLVKINKNGDVSLFHNPSVNRGQSVISGATSPEGIEGIESELAVAQQLGHSVVPMSLAEYAEAALDISKSKGGLGVRFGSAEQRKMREEFKNQTDAVVTLAPLLRQLNEDPQALQGIKMKPDGTMKKGLVNGIVSAAVNLGEDFRRAHNISNDVNNVTTEEGNNAGDLFSDAFSKFGFDSNLAQSRVIGLAYAIARARDSGGRLSDQDVALALRSLTGNGSPREIAKLFGDMLLGARSKLEAVDALVSNQPEIISKAQRDLFDLHAADADQLLNDLNMRATELGVAETAVPGVKTTPDPVPGKVDPVDAQGLSAIEQLLRASQERREVENN